MVTAAIVKLYGSLALLQLMKMLSPLVAPDGDPAFTETSPLILEPNLDAVLPDSQSLRQLLPGTKIRVVVSGKDKL